ncbi:MAG TPA: class I tRNA ligase family protein [Candidatus Acidoferrum sp.]|nr:class I tRNA ligase family protein [Candidatus Acidoferrum sp.]
MKRYNPKEIEPKWQQVWQETGVYEARGDSAGPRDYVLDFFPYPSGAAMHVGHVRNYTISDTIARFSRMRGNNVLHPMGWDAFGLPAENYAIKTGISPKEAVAKNTERFKKQLAQMGIGIDWSREFSSTDPSYYKWTQWFFKLLFERGLAYQKDSLQWWCDTDKTVLANEQVEAGKCWRCGNEVTKKPLKQWFFKITDYADRLLEDLDDLDWSDAIKTMQRNWIGRSKGAVVSFAVEGSDQALQVFTTRPDTLFGATFMVVAPEHPQLAAMTSADQKDSVNSYIASVKHKSDIDRMETGRAKTGVFTGSYAINPANNDRIPIWVADYVLMGYGTGVIMAVPAHDERDHAFAEKYNLPVVEVVEAQFGQPRGGETHKQAIIAVVRNPKNGKVLVLDWGQRRDNWGGMMFVGGGIEAGEDPVVAAKREIAEETGYTHVKHVQTATSFVNNYFYSNVKNKPYHARFLPLLFELEDETQAEQKLDANEGQFKLRWVAEAQLEQVISEVAHLHGYRLLTEQLCYSGEGVMINSGKYNGLPSFEAREKIVADLAKKGAATERVNYKLRDWLISRQRYWGAPIPIVHCAACARRQLNPVLSINFYDQSTWEAIKNGTKTVESRALNPEEPERCFGDIKAGDVIELVNKHTSETMLVRVDEARSYKTLHDLHDDEQFAIAVSKVAKYLPWPEFEAGYANLAPGYAEKIAKHGLVAWRISLATVPIAVPDDQLPIELPDIKDYQPAEDGRSPLARVPEWVNTLCPKCGGPATRETDTMDGFACSSWYFLRFADPHNDKKPFDTDKAKAWLPVNTYVGGAEHAVMHLLYARFWTKVMFDAGLIDFTEPFTALRNQGMLLAPDGRKMSKSWGNVIAPDDLISEGYGADSIRLMELFIGPWNQQANWSTEGLGGCYRFLQRVWTLTQEYLAAEKSVGNSEYELQLRRASHKTIKKVTDDLESMGFNTAIASLMEFTNELYKIKIELTPSPTNQAWHHAMATVVQLLAPFAPHLAEELWHQLGNASTVHVNNWPTWDEHYLVEDLMTIAVQVNGKLRTAIDLPIGSTEAVVTQTALADEKILHYLNDKRPTRVVYVPGRIVNIVIV